MVVCLRAVRQPFDVLPCSRHRPVAVTDGSLTENLNKIGVRLWTGCPQSARLFPRLLGIQRIVCW